MIAQAYMMLQSSNLLSLLSTPTASAQNINVNMMCNFSQLVNILQGLNGPLAEKQGEPERQKSTDTQGNVPKSLLGDAPDVSSTSAAKSQPPSLLETSPMVGQGGPANPLLALFLEQQIRQQMVMQQSQPQAGLNQVTDLVSGNLKRRHVSLNPNPQSRDIASSTGGGGLLPTPNNPPPAPKPLLPNPIGPADTIRPLLGASDQDRSSGLLPTPDFAPRGVGKDQPIPHLMQSSMGGFSGNTGATRDDLNSPAKKFPKMDGAQSEHKTGLLGDIPEMIRQSIFGYATGRTSSNGTVDNSNKENNSFDPSTSSWTKQVKILTSTNFSF